MAGGDACEVDPPPIPDESKQIITLGPFGSLQDIMKINAVYYPNYRVYRGETPGSLNYHCINRVYYAFANLTADGYVFLSDGWADGQMEVDGAQGCLGSFMTLKRQHPHLQVLLSIGGANSGQNFAAVAAAASTRDNFAQSATALVREAGLDGLDIDWEHPSNEEEGRNFVSLLANIRLYRPDDKFILTAALPATHWALQHIDLYDAQQYLNHMNVMAYDFSGPWRPTAGHHSQLYAAREGENSGASAIDYIMSTGFPSRKILLGVPVFGRSFIGATGPGDRYHTIGGEDGTFEYKSLPRPGAVENTHVSLGAASCVGGDGGFVTYDNPATVALKAQYCRQKNLGGLFYWTGTADVSDGPRSLVVAGFSALHGP